ncbi:MAG: anthranilate synthase component I family protein [Treponema sp.]|jgi:anthranilate synthase component 1|nr:anthranilate synthase component I family protein [Treponema sp.]
MSEPAPRPDEPPEAGGAFPVYNSLESLKPFAAEYRRVPLYVVAGSAAFRDPAEAFRVLKRLSRQCFILESLEDAKEWGRYTFLGYDPKLELSCLDGELSIRNGTNITIKTDDPGSYIAQIIEDNRSPRLSELPPFQGGLVGYFSYDYITYHEKRLRASGRSARENSPVKDIENFKDLDLMLFDRLVIYDHLKNEVFLIALVRTDALEENVNRAAYDLENLLSLLCKKEDEAEYSPGDIPPLVIKSPFRPLFDKEQYCAMVEKAKAYIREGDIFQVVLSNRLEADVEGSLFETYRILRRLNPSPYMFYFSSDDMEIAGASPETLVKLQDGCLSTFPLAGTRKRGATAEEDAALEQELLADPKELAEHNMLVDLGRNDLGKICRFGSVMVEKYLSVEKFSHVMHIGSTVRGKICREKTALDAINAVLPAGTLSGAPKIRACEIINELENCKRGLYGGAIGYIDFSGNMDTCIAIRIAFKKNGRVFVRSGAGIVADSVPETEYAECDNKMKAVLEALVTAAAPDTGGGA